MLIEISDRVEAISLLVLCLLGLLVFAIVPVAITTYNVHQERQDLEQRLVEIKTIINKKDAVLQAIKTKKKETYEDY